jgi:hypothetical protein
MLRTASRPPWLPGRRRVEFRRAATMRVSVALTDRWMLVGCAVEALETSSRGGRGAGSGGGSTISSADPMPRRARALDLSRPGMVLPMVRRACLARASYENDDDETGMVGSVCGEAVRSRGKAGAYRHRSPSRLSSWSSCRYPSTGIVVSHQFGCVKDMDGAWKLGT